MHKSNQAPPGGAAPKQILLVDDDECFRRLITYRLESLGYRVTAESESKIALARFRHNPESFDVVLTDLSMPELSGFDFAQQVLSIRPAIPVIGMSGTLCAEDRDIASCMGWWALIGKESATEELPRELARLFCAQAPVAATQSLRADDLKC